MCTDLNSVDCGNPQHNNLSEKCNGELTETQCLLSVRLILTTLWYAELFGRGPITHEISFLSRLLFLLSFLQILISLNFIFFTQRAQKCHHRDNAYYSAILSISVTFYRFNQLFFPTLRSFVLVILSLETQLADNTILKI